MKKLFSIVLALLLVFCFVSCDNDKDVKKEEAAAAVDVEATYENEVSVATVDELINVLNELEESTKIILTAEEYDFEGTTTEVEVFGQTGWMLPLIVNNVALVAADGVTPYIHSTDDIENGSAASQDIVIITGENVVINGIKFGTRGSDNKAVEIIGTNASIKNTTFVGGGACCYDNGANGTTIEDCQFVEGASLVIANGSKNMTVINNTFSEDSCFNITGRLKTGWNQYNVDLSNATIYGNTFELGSHIFLIATYFDDTFGNFDFEKAFGFELYQDIIDTPKLDGNGNKLYDREYIYLTIGENEAE